MTVVHSVLPVSKVKTISRGFMSGSDSSPLCAPVNKIKIISRVFRSECDTDSSALCAPVNKIKIMLGARINVQATNIYSICKGF